MKFTSVIKVLCSLALLLSSLGSYATVTGHGHTRSHEVCASHDIDRAEIILSAFSILEDAVMPDEAPVAGSGMVHLTRFSDIFIPACIDHNSSARSVLSGSSVYFYHGQHAQAGSSVPLFISIRRLLI